MYILCIVPFRRRRGRARQPLPGRCSVEEELDEIQCTQHDKATESKIKKFTFIQATARFNFTIINHHTIKFYQLETNVYTCMHTLTITEDGKFCTNHSSIHH